MTTTTLERTEGLSVLNQAMAAIKEKIEEKRGVFNIQMEVSRFFTSSLLTEKKNVFTAGYCRLNVGFLYIWHLNIAW